MANSRKQDKPAFAKDQLAAASKYAGHRDVLAVLLKDGKFYTFEEADGMLQQFYEGEAK